MDAEFGKKSDTGLSKSCRFESTCYELRRVPSGLWRWIKNVWRYAR